MNSQHKRPKQSNTLTQVVSIIATVAIVVIFVVLFYNVLVDYINKTIAQLFGNTSQIILFLQNAAWIPVVISLLCIIGFAAIVFIIVRYVMYFLIHMIIHYPGKALQNVVNTLDNSTEDISILFSNIIGHIIQSTLGVVDFVRFIPSYIEALASIVLGGTKRKKAYSTIRCNRYPKRKITRNLQNTQHAGTVQNSTTNQNAQTIGIEVKRLSKKEKLRLNRRRIISIAAFFFAIVSTVATTFGMQQYIYNNGNEWLGYLVSFAIQTILFSLSMGLSDYWKRFSHHISKLFIIFFIAILMLVSSGFSFVFICKSIYASSLYRDADILLYEKINSEVDNAKDYIGNSMLYCKYLVIETLSEMDKDQSDSNNAATADVETNTETNEIIDLINSIVERRIQQRISLMANGNYTSVIGTNFEPLPAMGTDSDQTPTLEQKQKYQDVTAAYYKDFYENDYKTLKDDVKQAIELLDSKASFFNTNNADALERFISTLDLQLMSDCFNENNMPDYDYGVQRDAYKGREELYDYVKEQLILLKDALGLTLSSIDNSIDTSLKSLLGEFMSSNPSVSVLRDYSDKIQAHIAKLDNKTEDYSVKILNSYIVQTAIGNYVLLNELLGEESDGESINSFSGYNNKITVTAPNRTIPAYSSEEKNYNDEEIREFRLYWSDRLDELKELIRRIPKSIDTEYIGKVDMQQYGVSESILYSYDKGSSIRNLNDIQRCYTTEMNPLEMSIIILISRFNWLAIISFAFAFICDLAALGAGLIIDADERNK